MTNQHTFPNNDTDLLKFFIGYDTEMNSFRKSKEENAKHQSNYPPYNIKTVGETDYVIEIAVAGFTTGDIGVELTNRVLSVVGKVDEDKTSVYLHKGLASRAFERSFTLAESIEISDVILQDGLLRIFLTYIVPESQKTRKYIINPTPKKTLLG